MWGVASLIRQGLRWRRRRGRRSTARVVDESTLGHVVAEGADGGGGAARAVAPSVAGALARALLALACAVRFDGEDGGGVSSTEDAWAASVWRPRTDEVSHFMVRDSMRYAIYA